MKNIFLFFSRNFTFFCFLALEVFSIITLTRFSKTHEAYFFSEANEVIGRINSQYNSIQSYFDLQVINKQLANENARLRDSLRSSKESPNTSTITFKDTIINDTINSFQKYTYLPAKVVGNSISSQINMLTLQRGASQGVKKGMGVTGPDGIVGEVVEVSPNYCRVMSLLHRKSNISGMLKKDNATGNVEWDGVNPMYVTLKNIPKSSTVKVGDSVETSSYSSIFPPHLMIGIVNSIKKDVSSNFFQLKIRTVTNFSTLQYVYIINNALHEEQKQLEESKLKINE